MIKEMKLSNWKSFDTLEFKFESINIIIGANGSGKTNFLEALELVNQNAQGILSDKINIRGGLKNFKRFGFKGIPQIKIELNEDIHYEIKILQNKIEEKFYNLNPQILKLRKNLNQALTKKEKNITKLKEQQLLVRELTESKTNKPQEISKNIEKLNEIINENIFLTEECNELFEYIESIEEKEEKENKKIKEEIVSKILVLDPIPREIRGETNQENDKIINKDCSNIISYIANRSNVKEIEEEILKHLSKFTENKIVTVEFMKVGKNKETSQLYITEIVNNQTIRMHSNLISDGTLKFIALIAALVTREEGSLLAIEEIDNGISPLKTKEFLEIIDKISFERKVDVVLTTHNTALLDYIGENLREFVYYTYRKKNGYSNIIRLEEISKLPKLLSFGEVGHLMESGKIIEFIKLEEENESN